MVFAPLESVFTDIAVSGFFVAAMLVFGLALIAGGYNCRSKKMTPTEANYVFHWMLTISAGFLLLLCAFAIDFFILRKERKNSRQR